MWAQKNNIAVLGFLMIKAALEFNLLFAICPILYQQQWKFHYMLPVIWRINCPLYRRWGLCIPLTFQVLLINSHPSGSPQIAVWLAREGKFSSHYTQYKRFVCPWSMEVLLEAGYWTRCTTGLDVFWHILKCQHEGTERVHAGFQCHIRPQKWVVPKLTILELLLSERFSSGKKLWKSGELYQKKARKS